MSEPTRFGRLLYIDLSRGSMEEKKISADTLQKSLGGSGLGTELLTRHVDKNTDPLGPENPLIFMTGPFTGTPIPTSGRHQVLMKSPLTGIFAESDVGGFWGTSLRKAGYDGLVITGRADNPVYLVISPEELAIKDGSHVWGEDTFKTDAILRGETNDKAVCACIGPAGEKMLPIACIMHDGEDARAAGRCGTGAVMGAKNLKAIVTWGENPIPIYNRKGLIETIKKMNPEIRKRTEDLGKHGSAGSMEVLEEAGNLPIKNWKQGSWPDGAKSISGLRMSEKILKSRFFCGACPIGCGRTVEVKDSPYGSFRGAGYEYESGAMLGANCLIEDLEAVSYANHLCNLYGIDTISAGAVIAFAMECYENDLLSESQTEGRALKWGDPQAVIDLIEMMITQEGIGKLLGQGVREAARVLGPETELFAIHTKGLELPAHDPRAYNSAALAYSTGNRGGCHLQGFTHVFESFLTIEELGFAEVQDRFAVEGKGELVAKLQNLMSVMDSLKVCKYLTFAQIPLDILATWWNYVTGIEMDLNTLMHAGERIYNQKRIFNVQCGISRKDDTLPERMLKHPRGSGEAAENLPPLEEMLDQYYKYRGWDADGKPRPDKLKELGLDNKE